MVEGQNIIFLLTSMHESWKVLPGVIVRVSIAVKRHHDHGNSYEGKYLIEVVVTVQKYSPLSTWL